MSGGICWPRLFWDEGTGCGREFVSIPKGSILIWGFICQKDVMWSGASCGGGELGVG